MEVERSMMGVSFHQVSTILLESVLTDDVDDDMVNEC